MLDSTKKEKGLLHAVTRRAKLEQLGKRQRIPFNSWVTTALSKLDTGTDLAEIIGRDVGEGERESSSSSSSSCPRPRHPHHPHHPHHSQPIAPISPFSETRIERFWQHTELRESGAIIREVRENCQTVVH